MLSSPPASEKGYPDSAFCAHLLPDGARAPSCQDAGDTTISPPGKSLPGLFSPGTSEYGPFFALLPHPAALPQAAFPLFPCRPHPRAASAADRPVSSRTHGALLLPRGHALIRTSRFQGHVAAWQEGMTSRAPWPFSVFLPLPHHGTPHAQKKAVLRHETRPFSAKNLFRYL